MSGTEILVVEDEAIVAEDLVGKLQRLGYGLAGVAAEGEEAVAMAGRLRPHLVLMDIQLAGEMDGIEAAEAIGREYDIPVIFLTAHSDAATLSRAKITGASGYILKPFDERELATQIDFAVFKHQADEALRKSEQRFRKALDIDTVGVLFFDLKGNFLDANDTFLRMIGYEREDLERGELNSGRVTLPEWMPRTWQAFQELTETGRLSPYEKQLVRPDGSRWWGLFAGTRLSENECMEFIIDVTERRKMEEQLLQSQKMEAIGRLAAGVAHEFNNMLNVIHGNAELIRLRLEKQSPLLEYVREITDAAQRSAILADQLGAYHSTRPGAPTDVDLDHEIGARLAMLEALSGDAIRVHYYPEPSVWPVRIDPDQLDQLLVHLTTNAVDAISEQGEITIAVQNVQVDRFSAEADLSPGDYVKLSFADNGAGMDSQARERIFDPFFTTKDVGRGTGLGLSSIAGMIRQNHGGITVESEPGVGSTFHIFFPRSSPAAETET